MDGTSMVSQCPLGPRGRSFVYVFKATDAGTFMYHGHAGFSPVNLYGPLVIEEEDGVTEFPNWTEGQVDQDVNLFLSDAWNAKSNRQLDGILSKNFSWIGNPQSILINGRTRPRVGSNCSHPFINIGPILFSVLGANYSIQ